MPRAHHVVVALLLLGSVAAGGASKVTTPSVAQTYSWFKAGEIGLFVDVRGLNEFNAGHIAGAILLTSATDLSRLSQCLDKKIALYCWHGYDRSSPGSRYLAAMGFNDVNDIGGMHNLIPDTQAIDGCTEPHCGLPISTEPWDDAMLDAACRPASWIPLSDTTATVGLTFTGEEYDAAADYGAFSGYVESTLATATGVPEASVDVTSMASGSLWVQATIDFGAGASSPPDLATAHLAVLQAFARSSPPTGAAGEHAGTPAAVEFYDVGQTLESTYTWEQVSELAGSLAAALAEGRTTQWRAAADEAVRAAEARAAAAEAELVQMQRERQANAAASVSWCVVAALVAGASLLVGSAVYVYMRQGQSARVLSATPAGGERRGMEDGGDKVVELPMGIVRVVGVVEDFRGASAIPACDVEAATVVREVVAVSDDMSNGVEGAIPFGRMVPPPARQAYDDELVLEDLADVVAVLSSDEGQGQVAQSVSVLV